MIRLLDEVPNVTENGYLYVYPMGDNGRKAFLKLSIDYGCDKVIGVDNSLCNKSKEIVSLVECAKRFTSDDYLIIVSMNPDVIGDLRELIRNGSISEARIIYIYDEKNEFVFPNNFSDIRDRQLLFTASEIYKNDVNGCVAEAGVYRGVFSGKINRVFPDRKIYLFDTFEGFSDDTDSFLDKDKDEEKQWGKFKGAMADTSIQQVLERMKYRDNVEVRKGFVPATFEGVEEKFAFVNLDMDIYKPTKAALDWFWPRLSPGGYIFVHDYDRFDGITKAVEEFCAEKKVSYFRLGDMISVAFSKPLYQ